MSVFTVITNAPKQLFEVGGQVLTLAHACERSCLKMSDTATIVLCEVYDTSAYTFNTSRQLRQLVQSMTAESARTVAAEFIILSVGLL